MRCGPKFRSLVLTAKDITSEDRARLNGNVDRVIQKGAFNHDELLVEIKKLLAAA